MWDKEIKELKQFFNHYRVSTTPFWLNKHTLLNNPRTFIRSHLTMCDANNGSKTYRPYLDRLFELKKCYESYKIK